MLGYLCAYYRYYYPIEFITAFLNRAANDEDVSRGTNYANSVGIQVLMPRWGVSKDEYFFDREKNIIAKGLTSVKYLNKNVALELYNVARSKEYHYFMDVLYDISKNTHVDARQLDSLIKIDFFSEFGNQRELMRMLDLFSNIFHSGDAKKILKRKVEGTMLESVIKKYAVGVTKSGGEAKSYTLLDVESILREVEDIVRSSGISDLDIRVKMANFEDIMGYAGYTTGKEEDRRKLYVTDMFPLVRKATGVPFGYSVITRSIGSGKEGRFTLVNNLFDKQPVAPGNIIYCNRFSTTHSKGRTYYRLESYDIL